jgi:hypothetical protein
VVQERQPVEKRLTDKHRRSGSLSSPEQRNISPEIY